MAPSLPACAAPRPEFEHLVNDPAFVSSLGLSKTEIERDSYFNNITKHHVRVHVAPYPEKGKWMCEDEATMKVWYFHWNSSKCADARETGYKTKDATPYAILQPSQLSHIVEATESAVFAESTTGEILLIVIRDFVANKELLKRWTLTCLEESKLRRNVRRDDAGTFVLAGYTPGSRNNPTLGFSAEFNKPQKTNPAEQLNHQVKNAGMLSLLWDLMGNTLPDHIMESFSKYMTDGNVPALPRDPDGMSKAGGYRNKIGNTIHEITSGRLTPPSGGIALNYAR